MKCPKCQTDNPSDSSFCAKCGTQIQPASADFPGGPTETMKTPVKELASGSTFAGRCQVIEQLGKGGLVTVSAVQNIREKRFGFSLRKVEDRRAGDTKKGGEQ